MPSKAGLYQNAPKAAAAWPKWEFQVEMQNI